MRNAFGNTAELHTEGEAITIISLPTCQHQQLTNTERPQTGWSPTNQEMEKKLSRGGRRVKCLMKDPSQGGHLSA